MSGTIYTMQAANLFADDDDPSDGKGLAIAELKLPDLSEIYVDHHAGGSTFQIEVEMGVSKLEPTFKLNGFDPSLLTAFGLNSKRRRMFTAYGVIVDQKSGEEIEAKALMQGRLGKVAPDAFSRGNLMGNEYSINSVVHYELWFDGKAKVVFDWFTNTWTVDGVDQNANTNAILRIS